MPYCRVDFDIDPSKNISTSFCIRYLYALRAAISKLLFDISEDASAREREKKKPPVNVIVVSKCKVAVIGGGRGGQVFSAPPPLLELPYPT